MTRILRIPLYENIRIYCTNNLNNNSMPKMLSTLGNLLANTTVPLLCQVWKCFLNHELLYLRPP